MARIPPCSTVVPLVATDGAIGKPALARPTSDGRAEGKR